MSICFTHAKQWLAILAYFCCIVQQRLCTPVFWNIRSSVIPCISMDTKMRFFG